MKLIKTFFYYSFSFKKIAYIQPFKLNATPIPSRTKTSHGVALCKTISGAWCGATLKRVTTVVKGRPHRPHAGCPCELNIQLSFCQASDVSAPRSRTAVSGALWRREEGRGVHRGKDVLCHCILWPSR